MTWRSHRNARATGGKVPQFLGIGQASATLVVTSRAPNTTKLFAVTAQTFENTASEFRRNPSLNALPVTPIKAYMTSASTHYRAILLIFLKIKANESQKGELK
jgi:hypothetical protein